MSNVSTHSYQNMDRIMKFRNYENFTFRSSHNYKNDKRFNKSFSIKAKEFKHENSRDKDNFIKSRDNLKYKSNKNNIDSRSNFSYADENENLSDSRFRDSTKLSCFKYEKKIKRNSSESIKEKKIESENFITENSTSDNQKNLLTKDSYRSLKKEEESYKHRITENQINKFSGAKKRNNLLKKIIQSDLQVLNNDTSVTKFSGENELDLSVDYGNTLIITDSGIALSHWIAY